MTTLATTVADSRTMFRRTMLHMIRYPGLTGFVVGIPVILLLLFVYVLGGTIGAGLPGAAGTAGSASQEYLAYVVPGILLIGVAGIASGASIGIAQDMTEGIVARFRSMAISRGAVLTGHVLGNTVQGVLCLAIVLGVAVLMGLRPGAGPLAWLALLVLVTLISSAVSWVAVAMGMSSSTVEAASNWPMVFTLLPFIGSGFVPTDTMPGWLQAFAEWQPFTAFIEATRALLAGDVPTARHGWGSAVWIVVLTVGGYLWSRSLYGRRSVATS